MTKERLAESEPEMFELFKDDILTIFEDNVLEDVNGWQENLTNNQIHTIATNFLNEIPFKKLNSKEVKILSNEIINHVANKNLRFLLLEELNRLVSKPLKVRLRSGEIKPLILKEQIGFETTAPRTKFLKPLRDVINLSETLRRNIELFTHESRQRTGLSRSLKGKIDKFVDLVKTLDHDLTEQKIEFPYGENFEEDEIEKNIRDTFLPDKNRPVIKASEWMIEQLGFIEEFLKTKTQKSKVSVLRKPIKPVPEKISETKTSIKEFIKELSKEIEILKKQDEFFAKSLGKELQKGFAIHKAHDVHSIGFIQIYSDKSGIKEILIPPTTIGEDLNKLAHSLSRVEGLLVDINGKSIIEIFGDNKDFKKVLKALIKYMNSIPKGNTGRLIYKSVNDFGKTLVGGCLTHPYYNNNNYNAIMLNSNFFHNDLVKKNHKGGSLANNYLLNPIGLTLNSNLRFNKILVN